MIFISFRIDHMLFLTIQKSLNQSGMITIYKLQLEDFINEAKESDSIIYIETLTASTEIRWKLEYQIWLTAVNNQNKVIAYIKKCDNEQTANEVREVIMTELYYGIPNKLILPGVIKNEPLFGRPSEKYLKKLNP
jgi:hypothetical protein